MVAIVIVSHSRLLAEGVKELAEQMTQGKVPLAAAGGIDDQENPIGTDPMAVMAAIEAMGMEAEDGVLVLMDLGSALMSAETALDFIDEELKEKVRLCAAPLVEGTMAAAVQASVGASLAEVEAEALSALAAKAEQLAPITEEVAVSSLPESSVEEGGLELHLTIANPLGLHARPAASLVSCVGQFSSRVTLEKAGKVVSARSINQVATLAVKCGDDVILRACGDDATEAIEALKALHADHFGEDITTESTPLTADTEALEGPADGVVEGEIKGIAASVGVAAGPVVLHKACLPEIETRSVEDTESEVKRLKGAIANAISDISLLAKEAEKSSGKANAAIFDVHRLILEDPELTEAALARIQKEKVNADAAWMAEMKAISSSYAVLEDIYMKERAADVMDAGGRVLRHLVGETAPSLALAEPGIVVAHDLLPSDVAGLDPEKVLAIVCEVGGQTSHAAILARGLGLPAVVGASGALSSVTEKQEVVVDGSTGVVELSPETSRIEEVTLRRKAWLAEQVKIREEGMDPAITVDGVHVHVVANIGVPADAERGHDHGAEGVGLFRTEFLFQERDAAPTEEEQVEAYRSAARAMKGHPVIIRTLDVGGDKPLAYVAVAEEENPFLGERGVRLCLNRPELFKPQLRALLLAAQSENIKIMVPMISHPDELKEVKALLQKVAQELKAEGKIVETMPPVGIMIEVPSAVALADQLAKEAAFFSIGTNDLTQYVMAADRGNAQVAGLSDSLHPAVLRMIAKTVHAAKDAGIPVGMCGELAGRVQATPLLLGLGLDELSMSAPSIPRVKSALRDLSKQGCQDIAERAMTFSSGREVRDLLNLI
ncbi:MAG: phosphoenolpyruvate--protein phosphotransferase [Desulfobacterales bacterium]|nr:phosphoenolpyruvate--protein phosphotransferase [Desulfobacterales bacterium]